MSATGAPLKVHNIDAGLLPKEPHHGYKPALGSHPLRQNSTSHASSSSPEPAAPSSSASSRPSTLPPLHGLPGLSSPTPYLQPQRDLERTLSQQQSSTAASLPQPPAQREHAHSSHQQQQQQQQQQASLPPKAGLTSASPDRSLDQDPAHSEATSPLPADTLSSSRSLQRPPKHVPPLQESSSGVRYAHHAFVPKPRAQSAFMRRHQAAHPTPAQRMRMVGPKGSASARPRRRVPMTSLPEEEGSLLNGGDSWSHMSSMGDLEALDTILDTLVVADPKMRKALLQGPLVSFETVVPQPKSRKPVLDEDVQDKTFNLTSVPGVVEEGMLEDAFPLPPALDQPDMEALRARALQEQEEADHREREQQQQQQQHAAAQEALLRERQRQLAEVAAAEEQAERPTLQATAVVPVPILPKLARMYISSKQTQAAKVPPPPPPTAHWLVHSRPHPSPQAAPSYDTLCNQIRDVQRQYTCGTSPAHAVAAASEHEPGRPPRVNPNLGVYISGLDGPPLDEVAQAQGLPQGVERSRPSFVAMQQSKRKGMRSRSPGQGVRRNSLDFASYQRADAHPDTSMLATGDNVRGDQSFDSD